MYYCVVEICAYASYILCAYAYISNNRQIQYYFEIIMTMLQSFVYGTSPKKRSGPGHPQKGRERTMEERPKR